MIQKGDIDYEIMLIITADFDTMESEESDFNEFNSKKKKKNL